MLLWFTDLMNVTEEVTVHRPNILTSAFVCLEAWHINSTHAPLNCDNGSLLHDAYLHLIRKKATN